MTVVVDTPVWSAFLRGRHDLPFVEKLAALALTQSVVLVGIVLQEVVQGFRRDDAAVRARDELDVFPVLPLDREDYVAAADLHRRCAAAGIAASTQDCQIAAAALVRGYEVLSTDRDFAHIARVAPLKLTAF